MHKTPSTHCSELSSSSLDTARFLSVSLISLAFPVRWSMRKRRERADEPSEREKRPRSTLTPGDLRVEHGACGVSCARSPQTCATSRPGSRLDPSRFVAWARASFFLPRAPPRSTSPFPSTTPSTRPSSPCSCSPGPTAPCRRPVRRVFLTHACRRAVARVAARARGRLDAGHACTRRAARA